MPHQGGVSAQSAIIAQQQKCLQEQLPAGIKHNIN